MKWTDIWKLFDPDEQHDACLCLLDNFVENWQDRTTRRVLRRIAEGTGSRLSTVEEQVKSNRDKAAHILRSRAAAILDEESWSLLFTTYYTARKSGLLCAFLDEIGIEHDETGRATVETFEQPTKERIETAVSRLLRSYTPRELGRYLAVLVRHAPGWDFAAAERDRVLQSLEAERAQEDASATSQSESAAASSMEFNVLDRVIIEQIVRAAMQIEGSLDSRQVEELVETTARLSDKWYRGYFHLGFMDVLLPDRSLRFERPGDNQLRRGWYLAGAVAGLVRSNDAAGLRRVFDERANELSMVMAEAGGPGASIAKTAFRRLLEEGRILDGVKLLKGQLAHLGLDFATEALDIATLFIRQSKFEAAKAIVDELSRQSLHDENEAAVEMYALELGRRRGQCLQAAGDFDGAEREYRRIVDAGEDRYAPDVLADLGLVKGRFRNLSEIRLPEVHEDRIALREALLKGEEFFRRAVQRFGSASPKSAYALAVLAYLRWTFASGKDKDERREQAADLASAAVSAILTSEFAAVYREIGALGQAYFMLAVSKMSSFDDVQGRGAMAAWEAITEEAGRLPLGDIKLLLQAAEPYGSGIADPIAESVWKFRGESALQVLMGGPWMTRSPRLRAALIAIAKQEQTPRTERIRLWRALVPQLIQTNELRSAEDGLAELEQLPESEEDCVAILEFLADRTNYDPVLKESEAAWTRIFLLRRIGRDEDCANELRRLFYLVRDSEPWEAEQILESVEDWKLDAALATQLRAAMPRVDSEALPGIDARLAQGERVRVVFIGGNEVQARYDGEVREQLHGQWPGLDLHFEHTAWSSNWGKDLDRLIGLANGADAVVLMYMMRTMLGRRIRAAIKKP